MFVPEPAVGHGLLRPLRRASGRARDADQAALARFRLLHDGHRRAVADPDTVLEKPRLGLRITQNHDASEAQKARGHKQSGVFATFQPHYVTVPSYLVGLRLIFDRYIHYSR